MTDAGVQQFLTIRKYFIPVLRGESYADAMGVNGIPTTLFIDPQGNIVFRELGSSPHLVQEFDWRLAAMEQKAGPATAARQEKEKSPKTK